MTDNYNRKNKQKTKKKNKNKNLLKLNKNINYPAKITGKISEHTPHQGAMANKHLKRCLFNIMSLGNFSK